MTAKIDPKSFETIFKALRASENDLEKVELYKLAAKILSRVAGRRISWSWRYIQSVYNGTIRPGRRLGLAVETAIKKYQNGELFNRPPKPRIKKQIDRMTTRTRQAIFGWRTSK